MTDNFPAVMDFLQFEYQEAMLAKNEELKVAQGDSAPEIDIPEEREKIKAFLTFCACYLEKNRPVQLQHQGSDYIIQLSNLQQFRISPGEDMGTGSMQMSPSVPVTGHDTAKDYAAAVRGGADPQFGSGVPIRRPAGEGTRTGSDQNLPLPSPKG